MSGSGSGSSGDRDAQAAAAAAADQQPVYAAQPTHGPPVTQPDATTTPEGLPAAPPGGVDGVDPEAGLDPDGRAVPLRVREQVAQLEAAGPAQPAQPAVPMMGQPIYASIPPGLPAEAPGPAVRPPSRKRHGDPHPGQGQRQGEHPRGQAQGDGQGRVEPPDQDGPHGAAERLPTDHPGYQPDLSGFPQEPVTPLRANIFTPGPEPADVRKTLVDTMIEMKKSLVMLTGRLDKSEAKSKLSVEAPKIDHLVLQTPDK